MNKSYENITHGLISSSFFFFFLWTINGSEYFDTENLISNCTYISTAFIVLEEEGNEVTLKT